MKRIALAALLALAATPTLATPQCYTPKSGNVIVFEFQIGKFSETERAQFYEQRLRMMGIDARQTTFWNNCIQTDVRENGKLKMRFYDPWTLEEVPLD
ncbi:MAG: hypothetical protein ABIY37_07115 [Devosia sp.]